MSVTWVISQIWLSVINITDVGTVSIDPNLVQYPVKCSIYVGLYPSNLLHIKFVLLCPVSFKNRRMFKLRFLTHVLASDI